jgi:hypothetical protein
MLRRQRPSILFEKPHIPSVIKRNSDKEAIDATAIATSCYRA